MPSNMYDNLEVTPEHMLKPKLEFVGRIMGRDVYADVRHEQERALVEELLKVAIKRLDMKTEAV